MVSFLMIRIWLALFPYKSTASMTNVLSPSSRKCSTKTVFPFLCPVELPLTKTSAFSDRVKFNFALSCLVTRTPPTSSVIPSALRLLMTGRVVSTSNVLLRVILFSAPSSAVILTLCRPSLRYNFLLKEYISKPSFVVDWYVRGIG